MTSKDLTLAFEKITSETDIPELTAVMTRAFDDDVCKHQGQERGGPDGYDNGDFFRKWLFGYDESVGYKIMAEGQIIGAFIVWPMPDRNNYLGTIFVDPAHQDCGVGVRAWQFIEAAYPDTLSWMLETPAFAKKNHYFYEKKCGFTKVEERDDSFIYRKVMG
ncbi:MAG TPA: GNAT family N-acetyltransferase [Anaerolineae bacterium]|nr:GNAT family N-acetyltransferase [Anaerolineae bacterium]